MIEFRGVTKVYATTVAVSDASFRVPKGRVVGLLGRNGAGKTTLMNMLTGYIPPTKGAILVSGRDILADANALGRMIGYLPEMPPLYEDMTVLEYMRFVASIKRVSHSGRVVDGALQQAGIEAEAGRLIGHLSKGYRQRVGLAQALVGEPPLLVLDEPTAGLDPRQIIETRRLVKRLGQTHTILLSSHSIEEISEVCDSVVILHRGRVRAENTIASLTSSANTTARLRLRVRASEADARKALAHLPIRRIDRLAHVETGAVDLLLDTPYETDIRADVFDALAQSHMPILAMQRMDIGLEEIFLQLTGDVSEG